MDIFVVMNHGQLLSMVRDLGDASQVISDLNQELMTTFNGMAGWNRAYYVDAGNYAAQQLQHYKVYRIDDGVMRSFPQNWQYSLLRPGHQIAGITDVTDQVYRVEEATFDGALKLFATVVKQGIKSTGMEVIVDPQFSGTQIRPIEEYEALVGTFARVKATTDVTGYGWQVLFFAPESLGNYRIETQQVNGRRLVLL